MREADLVQRESAVKAEQDELERVRREQQRLATKAKRAEKAVAEARSERIEAAVQRQELEVCAQPQLTLARPAVFATLVFCVQCVLTRHAVWVPDVDAGLGGGASGARRTHQAQ